MVVRIKQDKHARWLELCKKIVIVHEIVAISFSVYEEPIFLQCYDAQ